MIPPDANATFVAAMEDVLDVYLRPHDPRRPLVCLDETSKQLIRDTRRPIAMRPGQPARHDYECLDRRIDAKAKLIDQAAAWNADRNTRHAKVTWRLTTADARIKLKRLYPRFE